MQATRQRVLDYLEQRGSASAPQLAQAFGMTSANLRRHLNILLDRQLIEPISFRAGPGRGRPEAVYGLVADSRLEPLTRALLKEAESANPKARAAQLKQLASSLIGEASSSAGQSTRRLVAAVERLTPLGYKPGWEARPQGPQVVLGRCPYASIVADHPILCELDAHLLETMLGVPMEQRAKLQPGPQGLPQCVFVVRSAKLAG